MIIFIINDLCRYSKYFYGANSVVSAQENSTTSQISIANANRPNFCCVVFFFFDLHKTDPNAIHTPLPAHIQHSNEIAEAYINNEPISEEEISTNIEVEIFESIPEPFTLDKIATTVASSTVEEDEDDIPLSQLAKKVCINFFFFFFCIVVKIFQPIIHNMCSNTLSSTKLITQVNVSSTPSMQPLILNARTKKIPIPIDEPLQSYLYLHILYVFDLIIDISRNKSKEQKQQDRAFWKALRQ